VKADAGVKDRKIDSKRGTLLVCYMGLLAEIAVAKALRISVNQDTMLGGDEGFDLSWNDLKVQIKYTFHERGHLIINRTGNPGEIPSDIYVLTKGSESRINIVGYTTREHARISGQTKDFGYGDNFVLEQWRLLDFARLARM
jgi:hypothetical protein